MTEYVKKDGEGACFKKVSKNGTPYYNGSFKLDGKEFWISLFTKKSQAGETYVSFVIQPKEQKPTEEKKEQKGVDSSDIDDEVPF